MGGIGAADIFPRQANMSVSLAHTAIRIFHLFPSRPITALNTGRVSLTKYRPLGKTDRVAGCRGLIGSLKTSDHKEGGGIYLPRTKKGMSQNHSSSMEEH